MKGFIEVTKIDSNKANKTLVSVANIKFVEDENGEAFISMYGYPDKKQDRPWLSLGLSVKESYSEVVEKIRQALE